jgi:ribonuclease P protein component
MLPKAKRLTKRLFSESFSHSKITSNDYFTLRYKDISGKTPKVSVVVSKKVAQKATDRNYLKRKMYEIAQKHLKNIEKPYVLMLFPKKTSTTLSFTDLDKEVREILVRAKILQ